MTCPDDCKESRRQMADDIGKLFEKAVPGWILRGIVALVFVAFSLVGGLYLYAGSTYATVEDLEETRRQVREIQHKQDESLRVLYRIEGQLQKGTP